ncbi:hypothetical protein A3Q56_05026 [Intoshia linei]|uniref:DIRP domain-containing protein n=1 Tax=Intoshia linei TaxID=1819745 RepID=A0A177AYZ8_9BILA|nr:hypothetical protein A3Q56_05026 [Intoshia linei]
MERQYPQRKRKKNPKFFNPDNSIDFEKQEKFELSKRDRMNQIITNIGLKNTENHLEYNEKRLRNFLGHFKAMRWAYFEFFVSTIDSGWVNEESDFSRCIKKLFPEYCDQKLNRKTWNTIKRKIGKPRRFSPAFILMERTKLMYVRNTIREIVTFRNFKKDYKISKLTCAIPLPIAVGTSVTARLTEPTDGLYKGIIAAIERDSNMVRVVFDKSDIFPQSVPDYNILNNNYNQVISSKDIKFKNYDGKILKTLPQKNNLDYAKLNEKILACLIRMEYVLIIKGKRIIQLKDLNNDFEKMNTPELFSNIYKYISLGKKIDRYNKCLSRCLHDLDNMVLKLPMNYINDCNVPYLIENCQKKSQQMMKQIHVKIENEDIKNYITWFTSILFLLEKYKEKSFVFMQHVIDYSVERMIEKIPHQNKQMKNFKRFEKLNDQHQFMVNCIEQNCVVSLQEHLDAIRLKFYLIVSKVFQHLNNLVYILKTIRHEPEYPHNTVNKEKEEILL